MTGVGPGPQADGRAGCAGRLFGPKGLLRPLTPTWRHAAEPPAMAPDRPFRAVRQRGCQTRWA